MRPKPLTPADYELIKSAQEIITKRYNYHRHVVGAALRTKKGTIVPAVHIEANVGRISVCAEAIAIGKAVTEGEHDFETIVAVCHPDPEDQDREIKVVSPCGMCRELIADYGTDIDVIFPLNNEIVKCNVLDLLPSKYV